MSFNPGYYVSLFLMVVMILLVGHELSQQADALVEYQNQNQLQTTRINELEKQVEINYQKNQADTGLVKREMEERYQSLCERMPNEWGGAFPVC